MGTWAMDDKATCRCSMGGTNSARLPRERSSSHSGDSGSAGRVRHCQGRLLGVRASHEAASVDSIEVIKWMAREGLYGRDFSGRKLGPCCGERLDCLSRTPSHVTNVCLRTSSFPKLDPTFLLTSPRPAIPRSWRPRTLQRPTSSLPRNVSKRYLKISKT